MKIYELEKKLNYFFKNKNLLIQSLSHKSLGIINNEKLEFLGDSVLNFVITNLVYNKFVNFNEGDMSYIRSNLVKSKNLIKLAKKLKIKNYINYYLINDNIEYSINYLLANSVEAIIGAIFLDGGIISVEKFIFNKFKNELNKIKINNIIYKDSKTLLQEFLQKLNFPLPIYKLIKIKDYKDNLRKIYVSCEIKKPKNLKTNSVKFNKKDAEQHSAKKMLKLLYNINNN